MTNPDKNRFQTMADGYDKMAPYLVPQYDFLQNQALDIVGITPLRAPVLVDLGAGSGILLEKALERNATVTCYWVDSSQDFERVARQRLARFADRVRFVLSPLEDAWEAQIKEAPDAILSMSAIHHLESEDKRRLYQRCHDLLKPGGWFANVDEMKSLSRDAYRNSMLFWSDYVAKIADCVPPELIEESRGWAAGFERWKARNIDGIDRPKTKGDDIHDRFDEQVVWLREAGFAAADVFIKYHLWCIIGGQKA